MTRLSDRTIARLRGAASVAAFTGAGMSAESGVPTFRGEDGIWKKFRPEELASFDAFMRNPDLVWEWYAHRRALLSSVRPNPGHYALAAMEERYEEFCVITQNVDGLHRKAGSTAVHELHGNITRNTCVQCGTPASEEDVAGTHTVPRCTRCGSLIRPDVVWFGELLPQSAWDASVAAAEHADLFLVIGTSGIVAPASSLPLTAQRAGAFVLEINIEPSELSARADEVIIGKAGEVLPEMLKHCPAARPRR